MQFVANKGFSYILETLDKMIGEQTDEDKRNKLQEIRDNQNILRKSLIDAFMDLGIVAKIRKAEDVREVDRTEIREDALKAEDSPENIWDRVTLQAPRKQNASISTKMFLRRIPKYKKEYYEDGQVAYIPDNDEFGEPKAWNQDEAWRLILDNLWMCDSFSERDEDGNYSPTSIMGIVESQIDTNPFFHALYEKLEDLDYSGDYGDI